MVPLGRDAIEKVLAACANDTLMDQTQYKGQQAQQVNQKLNLVYGLVVLAMLAGLAGIAAAIAPSRRAARLDVLRAVTTE